MGSSEPREFILGLPLSQGAMSQNAGWGTMNRHTDIHTSTNHEPTSIQRYSCNIHKCTYMCNLTYTHTCVHCIHMHESDECVYIEYVYLSMYRLTYIKVEIGICTHLSMHACKCKHTYHTGTQAPRCFLWFKIRPYKGLSEIGIPVILDPQFFPSPPSIKKPLRPNILGVQ